MTYNGHVDTLNFLGNLHTLKFSWYFKYELNFRKFNIEKLTSMVQTTNMFMTISINKSSFLYQNVDIDIRNKIVEMFPFRMDPLTVGFKYLGYHLKPLGYHTSDWRWMIELFERKIQNWTYRYLSRGGRVVLIKAVLTGLAVYWFALARCPKSILNVLCKIMFSFL